MSGRILRKPKVEDFGSTPEVHRMLRGVLKDSPAEVAKAIEDGADPNAVGVKDLTPLLFSLLYKKNSRGIGALIEGGANPNWSPPDLPHPMHVVAGDCDGKLLKLFLAHGASVDPPEASSLQDEPYTGTAIYGRCVDNFRVLLDAGADINAFCGANPLLGTLINLDRWRLAYDLVVRGADVQAIVNVGYRIEKLEKYAPPIGDPERDSYEKLMDIIAQAQ